MILGLGMDLCDIERMRRAIGKAHFLQRVFTEGERERIEAASDVRKGEIAAGLFAAKEAVAKALGTGFTGFGPAEIEIAPDVHGKPTCTLYRGALEWAGEGHIHVTITHESGMAAATAIWEGEVTQ